MSVKLTDKYVLSTIEEIVWTKLFNLEKPQYLSNNWSDLSLKGLIVDMKCLSLNERSPESWNYDDIPFHLDE